MLDTDDLQALNSIKKKVGLKILPRLTDSESMRGAIIQYQKNLKDEFGDIIKSDSDEIKTITEKLPGDDASEGDLKKLAEELPVVRIVDTLLKHAIIQNASDIHIEPLGKIRFWSDIVLMAFCTTPWFCQNTSAILWWLA